MRWAFAIGVGIGAAGYAAFRLMRASDAAKAAHEASSEDAKRRVARTLFRDFMRAGLVLFALMDVWFFVFVVWDVLDPAQHAPLRALVAPAGLLLLGIAGFEIARRMNISWWVQMLTGAEPGEPLTWDELLRPSSEQAFPADTH